MPFESFEGPPIPSDEEEKEKVEEEKPQVEAEERAPERLINLEEFENIKEEGIKEWKRAWKLNLIESMNPDWHD